MDGQTKHALNAARQHGSVLCFISCPDCGLPAVVTDLFTLGSADGPVEHVGLACVAGHCFRLGTDRLPADSQGQLAASRDCG
jgi:hypothetical protein